MRAHIHKSLLATVGLSLGFAISMGLSSCSPTAQNTTSATAHQSIAAGSFTTFEDSLAALKADLDIRMTEPFNIPVPKDGGGGYTHETHKSNGKLVYNAASVYELTGEQRYADFAGKLLMAYADVYPTYGKHPKHKEQTAGRMFWQSLNESMWLVYTSQGYGAIKATLSEEQRDHIETNVMRNMADFLSVGSEGTFDRIHNHGTWANAAVGLTGYAIGDENYVEQALLGLDKAGNSGFLNNLIFFSRRMVIIMRGRIISGLPCCHL